ncbi:hypothetical protein POTOM_013175 [Populus tomentosa]|uniref:Uncharacterized protein n=1 Tax=Populus tomentosa TaxID=118781 RepID=A0A8X8CY87_POPTO|nr:hypothetical protein POTOM_013175 [Populus tomentosa]
MGRQWSKNRKYLKKKNTFTDIIAYALTTMLDPTIPLTTSEWEEWGDPRKEVFSHCMKSYSPVDNVSIQL